MSAAVASLLVATSDAKLWATRRLLHRAIAAAHRLGWPQVNPFEEYRGTFAEREGREPDPLGDPQLLAALCVEVSAELERRGRAHRCLPCEVDLRQGAIGPVAGSVLAPVPSPAASGIGG